MRTRKLITGVGLLGLAVLLILNKLEIISFHFEIWTIILTIFFGVTLIQGLVHRRLTESIFSIAFLCMIYASELGIEKLVPWTILATALLIDIGLSLIFHSFFKYSFGWSKLGGKNFDDAKQAINSDEKIIINERMSSSIRYVKTDHLQRIKTNVTLATLRLYFNQTELQNHQATLIINSTLSEIRLYVPKEWDVAINIDNILSEIKEENKPAHEVLTERLNLRGSLNLSEVKIIYV